MNELTSVGALEVGVVVFTLHRSVVLEADIMTIVAPVALARQEYWSGSSCPPPGNLSDPEIKPTHTLSFDLTNLLNQVRREKTSLYLAFKFPCLLSAILFSFTAHSIFLLGCLKYISILTCTDLCP